MPIYEKPTRELMHEFAAQRLKPGQVFSRKDVVRWFADHYPDIKSNTVGMHVNGMSVGSPRRLHSPNIRPGAGWDLFIKLSPREFRLWDPETDPAARYKADFEADIAGGVAETDDISEKTPEEEDLGSRKFAFERDLQNYLVQNLGRLEPGLKLYEDEDAEFTGVEFPAGQRYIDILAVGTDDAYVGDRDQSFPRLRPSRGTDSSIYGLDQTKPRRRSLGQGHRRRQRDFRGPHPGNFLH